MRKKELDGVIYELEDIRKKYEDTCFIRERIVQVKPLI